MTARSMVYYSFLQNKQNTCTIVKIHTHTRTDREETLPAL